MKGKVVTWVDDKGFGFIARENGDNVFFHVSRLKNASRKPRVGDSVLFDVELDERGRARARQVLIEGATAQGMISTPPVRKDLLDYLLLGIGGVGVLAGIAGYLPSRTIQAAMVPAIVSVVALLAFALRTKKPINPQFTCSKCRSNASHNPRTIQAWNQGMVRLYCSSCHQHWLQQQPAPVQAAHTRARGSGCLGLFALLVILPPGVVSLFI